MVHTNNRSASLWTCHTSMSYACINTLIRHTETFVHVDTGPRVVHRRVVDAIEIGKFLTHLQYVQAAAAAIFDRVGNTSPEVIIDATITSICLPKPSLPTTQLKFATLSGPLRASRAGCGRIAMDFPLNNPSPLSADDAQHLQPLVRESVGQGRGYTS